MNRSVDDLIALNPYPGLRAFDTSESDRFCGRRQQVEDLAGRLDEVPFVAVAGTSGCGKSSLVRAGLLSHLDRTDRAGSSRTWRCTVMRPGNRPIANLAEHLLPLLAPDDAANAARAKALYGRLTLGGLSLAEEVRRVYGGTATRILVVADQFEEVFRYQRMTDPDEASAFVKLLLNAAVDPLAPISVIITLRSETLGLCADFRDLPEAINRGLFLVPKLSREQRKEAIVKPAELRGVKVAPRLAQRLLNDVSDAFDDLPVMQHVLAWTWRRWATASGGARPIDLEDYEHPSVGTARHAISNHADEALASLKGLEAVTERVFRALTERVNDGTDLSDVRRPLEFNRLCDVTGAPIEHVTTVVERYRRPDTAFLMPPVTTALSDNPVVDISHESLMRQWKALHEWMTAEASDRAALLQLMAAATAQKDGSGDMWRGKDLRRVGRWQKQLRPTPAWMALQVGGSAAHVSQLVDGFLAASRRAQTIRSSAIGLGGLLLVVLAGLATYALRQNEVQSRELVSRALLRVGQSPATSAHLARAAYDSEPTDVAEGALRTTLAELQAAYTEKVIDLGDAVADLRYSRDGARVVAASGKRVHVLDARTYAPIGSPLERPDTVDKAWLAAVGTMVITQSGAKAQWQRLGDDGIHDLPCDRDDDRRVYAVSVSADERNVAIGCMNGDVRIWDTTSTGPPRDLALKKRTSNTPTALAFSNDGAYLASGDAAGAVTVWRLDRPGPWIGAGVAGATSSPLMHESAVRSLTFHPTDASLLATAGDDGQAIVWTLDLDRRRVQPDSKAQRTIWRLPHDRPVTQVSFVPHADRPGQLVTVTGKVARIWIDDTVDPRQAHAHDDWLSDASASADGALLVTASRDGTARVWSTRSSIAPMAILRGHRDGVTRAIMSPDGRSVLTASDDRTLRAWRIQVPQPLSLSGRWALAAAFSPNGRAIAVGEDAGATLLALAEAGQGFTATPRILAHDQSADMLSNFSWSRDGRFIGGLRSGYRINSTYGPTIWNADTRADVTPAWLRGAYWRVTFGRGTDEFVAVGGTGEITVWATAALSEPTDAPAPLVPPFGGGYTDATISPDGQWIAATGSSDNSVSLWRRDATQAPPRRLLGHGGAIRTIEFSRDSQWLVTSSMDHTARVWSVEAGGPPTVLGSSPSPLTDAAFSPDGTRVVTGGSDGAVRIYSARNGMDVGTLRWHSEGVNDVQYSADGRFLLTASDDGTVTLGECDVCALTADRLRDKVDERAYLTGLERSEVEREIEDTAGLTWLPQWFRRARRR